MMREFQESLQSDEYCEGINDNMHYQLRCVLRGCVAGMFGEQRERERSDEYLCGARSDDQRRLFAHFRESNERETCRESKNTI